MAMQEKYAADHLRTVHMSLIPLSVTGWCACVLAGIEPRTPVQNASVTNHTTSALCVEDNGLHSGSLKK